MIKVKSIYAGIIPTGFLQGHRAIIVVVAGYPRESIFNKVQLNDAPVMPSMDIAKRIIELYYDHLNTNHFYIYICGGEPSLWDFSEVMGYITDAYRFDSPTLSSLHKTKKLGSTWVVRTDGTNYMPWFNGCEIALAPTTKASMIDSRVLQQPLSIEMLIDNNAHRIWNDLDIRRKSCAKYIIPALVDSNISRYDDNITNAVGIARQFPQLRFQLDLGIYLPYDTITGEGL